MRKILPWPWNKLPVPRAWPRMRLYLNRYQWVRKVAGRKFWHGPCVR